MRTIALLLLATPALVDAQTPLPARSLTAPPLTTALPIYADSAIAGPAKAKPRRTTRSDIASKNETYNAGRAAEGRVGVRLGDDESYRITSN